jgi:deferrochelatase/peroxidase EfeB
MDAVSNADFKDMQGLLRFGYAGLKSACFLLLRIDDPEAASQWLTRAPASTAEIQTPAPTRALQLAFTRQGLERLGVPPAILNGFSAEFLSGMVGEDNRSRRLGDVGANSPDTWLWGTQHNTPDLMAMIYALPEHFEEWKNTLQTEILRSGFALLQCLPTTDMKGVEPFGFVDGVSSPTVDWERRRNPAGDQLAYENILMLGEFVLGYPNEYGLYTNRPTIDDGSADLPNAEDAPNLKDIGRNGTYLVMRQIDQDVRGFWRFLHEQSCGDDARTQELAEKLVGRKMSGESMLPQSPNKIPGVGPDADDLRRNQFTFESDPQGVACPFGAHIRRANPRNADLPPGTPSSFFGRLAATLALDQVFNHDDNDIHRDSVASTRFHRVLRRGREYGALLTPAERLEPASSNETPTGLNFICLNANIGRQFEFVQSAWIQSEKFDNLGSESDALLGNREPVAGCPSDNFSLPVAGGLRQQLHRVPRFTTVRGGAYFFLPGVRALRYLARAGKV